RYRLAEHRRFRLDAADTPAEYAQAIDHGGVGIGADQRIGVRPSGAVRLGGPHAFGQVLQIDLVTDAGARGYHAEISERLLAPAQEFITLAIAFVLNFHVVGKGG